MTESLKKLQCLNGFTLKIAAMLFMLADHIGYVFFPGRAWIRMIGRLALPIFAFFIAEGIHYTRSKKKYLLNMFIFALISEPVFDIVFFGRINTMHQNVLFTFLLAMLGLMVYDLTAKYLADEMISKPLGVLLTVVFAMLAEVFHTDYGCFGVMLVYIFYIFRESFWCRHMFAGGIQLFFATGIQRYSAASTLLLMMYNGKRGPKIKYLFYVFYPLHLAVLYVAAKYIFF